MALEHLETVASLDFPEPRDLVAARSQHLRALWIETDLGDLGFVADQDRLARARHRVVDARRAIGRRCHELRARGVEAHVEDLVVVATERLQQRRSNTVHWSVRRA